MPNLERYYLLAMADEYGRAVADAFAAQAERAGITLLGQELFASDAETVNAIVQKAIDENADAVVVTGFGRTPILCIRRLRELGFKGAIFADPATAYKPFTALIGDAAEGLYAVDLAFGPVLGGATAPAFRKDYLEAFGREADIAGAMAYAGMEVFAAAVERSGNLSVDSIAEVLDSGFTLETIFGETEIRDRDIRFPLVLKVIEDGISRPVQSN